MEEAMYKLRSRNSVLVACGVERLLCGVYGNGERELGALRESCTSADPLVAQAACRALLVLAARSPCPPGLEPASVMSTMLALLPTARNYAAIISTMGGLLILELKSRLVPGQAYTCHLSLKSPQHPFITVLQRNRDAAQDVLGQMQAMCFQPDYTIAQNSLELLRAVFLWLLCNPRGEETLRWRLPCWQLLLSTKHEQKEQLQLETLLWQQMSNPAHLQAAFTLYSTLADIALQQNQLEEYLVGLIPALARISNHFIRLGMDPRPCYNAIDRVYSARTRHASIQWSSVVTVPILAENLLTSPAPYLHELFALLHKIITSSKCPPMSINILVAYTLQWLHYPTHLTTEALKLANKILDYYQNEMKSYNVTHLGVLLSNKLFRSLLHTDRRFFIIFQHMRSWEKVRTEKIKTNAWLDSINGITDEETKLEFVTILLGMFLETSTDADVVLRVLPMLVETVKNKKDYAVLFLPVLVYKVANDPSSTVQLECLKTIPVMAHAKENVPTILTILNKLRCTGGAPPSFLLHLYSTLVGIQGRCYPYLQEQLADMSNNKSETELKWETEIARADAVKKICETRAGTYGAELVPVVSGLLNRCTEPSGVIASCIALEALRVLWNEGIVSVSSTWHAIAPKMSRDKRAAVHVCLCKLLGEVPRLRVQTPEYEAFVSEAARRVWSYIADSHHPEVIVAACEALANYKLEDYKLKDVPEVYRRSVKLPASYCKTPVDAARNPEDVLDYVPSEIWPSVFKHTNQAGLPGVRRLVSTYMEREVKTYRSGVYQNTRGGKTGEPESLQYLPPHSVVQGMMDYVRKQGTSPTYDCSDSVLLEMIWCVSGELARPLPPLEMCFLHELFHRGEHFRRPCLLLAARQALTSGSAKRFLDNYLNTAEPTEGKEEDILIFCELLPVLCRSVAPNVLRRPLDKYLGHAYTQLVGAKHRTDLPQEDGKEILFVKILDYIAQCLRCEKIHDANRTLLSQYVENYWGLLEHDSVVWSAYVEVCCALPITVLERVTSPSSWWETTPELVCKVASVRSALACTSAADASPLIWLNEIIDAAVTSTDEHTFVLRSIGAPLSGAGLTEHTRDWLLQLMARIQVALAESPTEVSSLTFLCDVFMLSVVLISSSHTLDCDNVEMCVMSRERRCLLLPAALAGLTERWRDSAAQMIEWLHHTRSVPGLPEVCRDALYYGLVACRHSAHVTDSKNAWCRILSVRS